MMASGDMLAKYFQFILQIKPILLFSSLSTLKLYFLWKEYLSSKQKFIKNQEWGSLYVTTHSILQISFIKEFSQQFSCFQK
jgi:hypothetical protein